MELKTGYKQTEVGVIPSDWKFNTLGGIFQFKQGVQCSVEKQHFQDGKGLKRFVRIIDLTQPSESPRYILDPSPAHHINVNDLFMVRYGSPGLLGFGYEGVIANNLFRLIPKTKMSNVYFYHLLSYKNQDILQLSSSTTMAALNFTALRELKITYPSTIIEQTSIATALSDTDQYITHLEKLIAKKRNIKQGAMQELLRAKEGWVVKKLGEVAEIIGGGTPSTFISKYWNGTINWFTPTEIGTKKYTSESIRKITKEGLSSCSATILPVGAILLTTRAGIGDAAILTGEGCTNQGFQSLVAKQGYNHEYIYYLVLTLKNTLLENASGSTFLEISPKKIKQIEILIPAYDVQAQIATILSDMDSEIATLETKLSKAQSIKQGMMQQLLTGKIRLI